MRHSAIYEGWIRHRRHEPVGNRFRYRLTLLYLDLHELPALYDLTALWSARGPNLAWARRADYLGDSRLPLKRSVCDLVEARTGVRPSGPTRMLTQVRTLGYLFNPVTFYYCYDAADRQVEAIVAEITNTPWLERHAYVFRAGAAPSEGRGLRFCFRKDFHVSPFMHMDMDYDWRFTEPGERLHVHMETCRGGRVVLDATLALERRPLTAAALQRALVRHPLATFKITAAIYWQALRLSLRSSAQAPRRRRARRPA